MHLTPDIHTVYNLKWNIIQKPINSWCSSAVCSRANEQCCSNTEQTAFLAQQKVKVSHTVEHSKEVMQIQTRSTRFASFATHSSHFLPLLSLKFPVSDSEILPLQMSLHSSRLQEKKIKIKAVCWYHTSKLIWN